MASIRLKIPLQQKMACNNKHIHVFCKEEKANLPVYCLDRVAPWIAEPPRPVVPVEQWVAAGAKLIEEIGAEAYLHLLIQNLRGD